MKKVYNKVANVILALCLTFMCFSFVSYAAEGTLQFTDPQAAAGDTVSVKAKVNASGSAIGDVEITATYDSSILKFVSGTNVSGENGTLQLSYKGDGTASEAEFTMEFTALKEGTATIEATSSTAYLYSNDTLNLTLGTSEVKIEGGTPVTEDQADKKNSSGSGPEVTVDGKTYIVNENFSEAAVPNGFTATDAELDGKSTKAMVQETSGQYMYYLDDGTGNSDYFLYSTEDGSFTPTEVVDVNTGVTIFLMNHEDKEGLPSDYKETTTSVSGKEFTAWNNVSDPEYYLVYALSSNGTTGYYQYDTTEGTYQRYIVAAAVKEKTSNTLTDKILGFAKGHMVLIMCVIWGVFLLFLILIIILSVKLSHRNQELDDLYDEYGIDDDSSGSHPELKKKDRDQFVGFNKEQDEEYDEYDDEYDEEYEDDEYDDEQYEDSEYDEEYEDDEFEEYDEDEDFDEYDDEEPASGRKKKQKNKDDYSVDFIDI